MRFISLHRETIDLILIIGIKNNGTTHPGVHLGPCQISLIKLFAKISEKAPSYMFYIVLNTPLSYLFLLQNVPARRAFDSDIFS